MIASRFEEAWQSLRIGGISLKAGDWGRGISLKAGGLGKRDQP